MINFINTGLDDQILKSLNAETPDEDLQKAMNKQGLVQKEIQVKGKNGQVFTRKQWVKAGEDQKSGKSGNTPQDTKSSSSKDNIAGSPVDISKFKFTNYRNPEGQDHPGRKTYRSTLEDVSKETEHAFGKVLSSYGGKMLPEKQLSAAFHSINNHSSFRDMVGPSAEQGLKDAKQALYERQKHLLEQAKQYTKWDGKKWVKESNVAQQSIQPKSGQSNSDYQAYQHNGTWITSIPDGINPLFHGNETYYFTISVYDDASRKYSIDKYFKTKKEAEDFIDNNVVNGILRNASQNDTSDKKQHWTKASTPQEAKQQITNLVASGKSREDCMSEFKAAGVTWKESDNAGINWMRACMAMNKYLMSDKVNASQGNGNSSQDVLDTNNKSSVTPDTNNVSNDTTNSATSKETPEYKNVSVQKFDAYNERRYSKPWIAVVDDKGKLDFSKDVGTFSGNAGESGELYVYAPVEGQVYAYGQKDNRGNNGGYQYVKFTSGKFVPIDKSDLTSNLSKNSSGKNVTIMKIDPYNSRRYSKPWVAAVNDKGKPDFSQDVGKYSGDDSGGTLYVYEPVNNQVYMFGQKDYRGNGTVSKYAVFVNGKFEEIDKKDITQYLSSNTPVPTHSNPLVVNDTKSGRPYQVWEDNGRIYGSQPGKQNSRFVNDIKDFSAAGFTSLDEVKDYIKQYF